LASRESGLGKESRIVERGTDMTVVATGAVPMIELWRGGLLESSHSGHAVICTTEGEVVEAWGNPDAVIFPRSSCKMLQALPLIESGAAEATGLTDRQLALSCASHEGAALHTAMVADWLKDLGLSETDLRCGVHAPTDRQEVRRLIKHDESPCQLHNNCSGKHAGFICTACHLGIDPKGYVRADHPVQRAVTSVLADLTGTELGEANRGIDGCSIPAYAIPLDRLAHAFARMATGRGNGRNGRI